MGNNATIYHNVTITEDDKNKVTMINNNVVIRAGTVILNNVRIGNGAVTKGVKDNEVVTGNSAEVIKGEEKNEVIIYWLLTWIWWS